MKVYKDPTGEGTSGNWQLLQEISLQPLPTPLKEVLRMDSAYWLKTHEASTEFARLPKIEMANKSMKAFASLGRCSVAVGLLMSDTIKQIPLNKAVLVDRKAHGRVKLYGQLEAGYFELLEDTWVVPHVFECAWRLHHVGGEDDGPTPRLVVQSIGVDGGGYALDHMQPPSAMRPWLPHQVRSFQWMVHREAVRDLFVCESRVSVATGLKNLSLEWKMDKAFDLRGGILCDPIGSGKTATLLALVLHDQTAKQWDYEADDAAKDIFESSWLTVNATLILCPGHVHEQWLSEVEKTFPEGSFNVVPIRTVAELRAKAPQLRALAEDSSEAGPLTIVVAALSVFQDPDYQELLSPSNSELTGWLQGQETWERGLALDCLVWRRLIIDEVHEMVHTCDASCPKPCGRGALVRRLRAIKSERRWGMTGTPEEVLRSPSSLECLGLIFRTDFNSGASARRFVEHYFRTNQVELQIPIQEQLELIELTPLERIIYQQRSRDFSSAGDEGEEVIGSGSGRDREDDGEVRTAFMAASVVNAAVPLLKLCSHFAISSEEIKGVHKDAFTEYDVALRMRDEKVAACKMARLTVDALGEEESVLMANEDTAPTVVEAYALVDELAPNLMVEPRVIDGEPAIIVVRIIATPASLASMDEGDRIVAAGRSPVFGFARDFAELDSALREELATWEPPVTGSIPENMKVELRDLERRQRLANAFMLELRKRAGGRVAVQLSWRRMGVAAATVLDASGAVGGLAYSCKVKVMEMHRRWHNSLMSFAFLDRLWSSLVAKSRVLSDCPVCFEEFDAARSGSILPCSHTYCATCSKKLFRKGHISRCPLCRLNVACELDVVDLAKMSVCKAKMSEAAEGFARQGSHGSKFARMCEVLKEIARSGERAVVFCQFADLELRISSALDDTGVEHVRLSAARDVFEQTAALDSFQTGRGSSRVLLLSLEQSASGTNLTCASHVLLVHPMAASTPERARAFEQQAIGRCVRLGQKKKVTVWRFITSGTVEEVLHNKLIGIRPDAAKKGKKTQVSAAPAVVLASAVSARGQRQSQANRSQRAPSSSSGSAVADSTSPAREGRASRRSSRSLGSQIRPEPGGAGRDAARSLRSRT